MLDLKSIQKAKKRVQKVAHKTPFSYAPILSEMSGYEVYLKKENLQITGAFKLRGAFNKIAILVEERHVKEVVAASAGNHAQGVAYSANYFNIKATIFMPDSTPLTKVEGVKKYGAKVVLKGSNYDEAYQFAIDYATKNGLEFVHPFTDREVIAGQGTVALEILEEQRELDAIIVPVGGGGLISGVATATKAINPNIKIIGVASAGASAMQNSFNIKRATSTEGVRTIADGIAVRDASPITLEYILNSVDDIKLVSEDEIAEAILYLLEKQKLLVEGAGAVGVSAVLHSKIDLPKGSKIGIVLSGGNIDVTMLSVIIEKGLVKSKRKMKLSVIMVDKPGSLMEFTKLLTRVGENIVQIGYDRTSTDLEFGDAVVSVHLETKGEGHQQQIRDILTKSGFKFKEEH